MRKTPVALLLAGLLLLSTAACSATSNHTTPSPTVSASPNGSASIDAVDLDIGYDATNATSIVFDGDRATISGDGAATASGGTVTITGSGTYLLSGQCTDGQIRVCADDAQVQLVLDGLTLHCATHAAIFVESAGKVILTLAADSTNALSGGADYVLEDSESNVDGVIFSRADLTLNGDGALSITAAYKHAIVSKDTLVITGGTYTIDASGKGLSGKDSVSILAGNFTIHSGGDAIQSDNTEDTALGTIYISGGSYDLVTDGDGIQAETALQIDSGTFNITTGGGSANASYTDSGGFRADWGNWGASGDTADTSTSAKALKAGTALTVTDGTFVLDASDDALHSNGTLSITGGTFSIATGDDGLHADAALTISGGTIDISTCYEGIEGETIDISGGGITLTAYDDGLNAAGGNDGSSLSGRPGANGFADYSENNDIHISGGTLVLNVSGDAIDSNGNLYISGGELLLQGPTSSGNGTLDYGGTAEITGGVVMALGASGMAQGFSESSTQCSLLYTLDTNLQSGTTIALLDSEGNTLLTFTCTKSGNSVLLSTPELVLGETYTLTAGDSSVSVTLDSVSTSNGSGMSFPGGMGNNPRPEGGRPSGGEPPTDAEGAFPGGMDAVPPADVGFPQDGPPPATPKT